MAGITKDMLEQLRHVIRPHAVRLANSIARGVVKLVNDGGGMQLVQLGVLDGETVEGRNPEGGENFQAYGFSSVPLAGAEAVVLFPNGDREHPLVVQVADRRHRPTGGVAGEVVMYTDEGDTIRLGRGHAIVASTSGTIKWGSSSAHDGVIKGTQRDTAEQIFLTALKTLMAAINTYAVAIKPIADPLNAATPVLTAAIATATTAATTFGTAATAAISSKVLVE